MTAQKYEASKPPATKAKPEPEPVAVVWETLAAALVAAQKAMPKRVIKDQENEHYKSSFLSLAGLIAATRGPLNDNGLAMIQLPTVSEAGGLVLTTILIHGPTGERLETETPLLVGSQNMQQLGSAITYARRYAWQSMLGIAAEDDDDGNSAGTVNTSKAKPKPKLITDEQRTRLWTIAREYKVDEAQMRDIVFGVTGDKTGSTKTIQVDQYDKIVNIVKADDVPF